MVLEGYVKAGEHLVAEVENITLVVDTVADVMYLEQKLSEEEQTNTVLVFGKDTAEDLIKLLQTWADSM